MQAVWIEDYCPNHQAHIHLIKVHDPEDINFVPDRVLTTRRPFAACFASLIRMGWLSSDPEEIRAYFPTQKRFYDYWAMQSDLEIDYSHILSSPAAAVGQVAKVLGLHQDLLRDEQLARSLQALKAPPAGKYDKETLLHPGHRTPNATANAFQPSAEQIAILLRDLTEGNEDLMKIMPRATP